MAGLLQESIAMAAQSEGSNFSPLGHAECRNVYTFSSHSNPTFRYESNPKHNALQESLCLHNGHNPYVTKGELQPTQNETEGEMDVEEKQAGKIEILHHGAAHKEAPLIVCDRGTHQKEIYNDIDAAVTVVALLKACREHKDLPNGMQIHADIVYRGFHELNVFVSSTLISMYAKCGALDEAQDVFDGLLVRNVVSWNALITGYAQSGALEKAQDVFDDLPYPCVISWNALIAGYVQHGHSKDALSCFERMQLAGFMPNGVTFACVLKACGSIGVLEKGQEIHADIAKKNFLEKDFVIASALVDMYAKCGALEKAQEVFDGLPIQHVASWNALIAGYTKHGQGEEALNCYERMQLQGFSPTAITFTCILKACGCIGASARGQEIHAHIIKECLLDKDIMVANALVDMYAKCGALGRAQEVLSELPVRDLVSWTGLIAGYANQGKGEEALSCYERMQLEGFTPDTACFACILKACGSIGAIDKGQQIHAKIVKDCFLETQTVVANSLVDMYAKCGALKRAQEVFDAIAVQDAVSWNALIAGYTQHGHGEEALNLFNKMQHRGFSPSAFTCTCILAACGSIKALDKGRELHALLTRESLPQKDFVVANALVDMYAKCCAFDEAQEFFDELEVHNVILWNALIAEYTRQGHEEEALECFYRMHLEGFTPDAVTFACILKVCGNLGALDKGQTVHAQTVRECCLEKDNAIGTALAVMYAKCGALEKAQAMFDELFVWDIVLWNALIAGYAQHGHGEKAFSYFQRMQLMGFCPNAVSFASVLKACGIIRDLNKGKIIHAQIVGDSLLEKDMVVGTALVAMYLKCGAPEKAHQVFEELPSRDVVSWNALIAGYVQHDLCEEAMNRFARMQLEGFHPDAVTYACILSACGSIGAAHEGQKIHAEIVRQGTLGKNADTGTALVVMYANCGMLPEAQDLFDKLPVQDVVSWSALIEGYAQLGQDEIALSLFEKMVREGIAPNSITFTIVLNACSHRGLLDKGQMYFEAISTRYGIIPTADHHTCMVDLFGRAGHFDKAVAVIREMPLFINVTMWHTLLGACQRWGLLELGRWVFEHAVQLELDERGAAAFVSMSNIYAAAGRQEATGKIETKNVEKQSWKQLEYCWWNDTIGISCLGVGNQETSTQLTMYR